MNDLISRQAAIYCCRNEWEEEVEERLRLLPSADVVEVVHGKWVIAEVIPCLDNTYTIECSQCGQLMLAHPNEVYPNYCCNCGAKMDKRGEPNELHK